MARVHILATGGTIAGRADSSTEARYRPSEMGIDALVEAVPGLGSLATVSAEQFSQLASQDMNDVLWLKLAKRVNELFDSDAADGVVITHGTDTAEETGYFLHLTVRSDRPVVLTGAMRAASSLSADGPLNLYNAVAVAAHRGARGHGVMLVINDDIHSARDATKAHTTDVHSFISPAAGLLGTATYGCLRYFRSPVRSHTRESEFSVARLHGLPRVDILYAHSNMPADLVRASAQLARGVVVAGVGNGNVSSEAERALAEVAKAGIVVVRSTHVGSGEVVRNGEIEDDALGFVAADQLSPKKSRVLLQLCLANGMDRDSIQTAFYRY